MVVRVPDAIGNMISKGNVLIPCQCYYNARDNVLTEIIQHSSLQLQQSETLKCNNYKKSKNVEKKDAQTETVTPYCCVCEYFKNLEMQKNRKELWKLQFNRWWGWNWKRKKDFMIKIRQKLNKNTTKDNIEKTSIPENKNSFEVKHPETSNEKIKTPKTIPEMAEPLHSIPHETLQGFKKPYVCRRKRNKQKQRLYKGWIKEISSSESDTTVKNIKIKTEKKQMQNNNDYMNYLSHRIQNLNSNASDEEKEYKNTDYISPFSGKKYNFDFSETVVFNNLDTNYLKPVDFKDDSIIPKPESDWIKQYNLMKEEHSELLNSISDMLYSSKLSDNLQRKDSLESEKEIYNFNYTPDYFQNIDIHEPAIDSIPNNITMSSNLFNFKPINPLIMNNSSNTLHPTIFEEQIENNKNLQYDINYISNNLESFSSTISVTEFLEQKE